jgi:ubiquinone/menaquinone biosynthesis C-methylase UbiE
MDAEQYERMADLQSHHWWFEAKRMIVRGVLARVASHAGTSPGGGGWALEVGCGTGSMAEVLRPWGRIVGMDAHLPALRHLRGVDAVGGNALALPFASRTFDLVGCFDVLYHRRVTDVGQALGEIYRVCRPGGVVIVTDSAGPRLMSAHDVAMHGARRFRLGDFSGEVEAAGFDLLHGSYYHTVLFPAAAAVRLLKRTLWGVPGQGVGSATGVPAHSDLTPAPPWLNASLTRLYQLEARLVAQHRLPFGLSLLVAARRPPH